MVSEDALRRALERIDEAGSAAWMRPSLMHSVREALDRPWVLDIDASIKPLYGRQQGAEIGYNPSKPMRPSHALHTFLVANLRLVLDARVSSGKQQRVVRVVAGVVLIGLATTGNIGLWGWIGAVPLATGLIGWCPAYAAIGLSTYPTKTN